MGGKLLNLGHLFQKLADFQRFLIAWIGRRPVGFNLTEVSQTFPC
jgi:hypothetical protein